jgi:hypothetical protein
MQNLVLSDKTLTMVFVLVCCMVFVLAPTLTVIFWATWGMSTTPKQNQTLTQKDRFLVAEIERC